MTRWVYTFFFCFFLAVSFSQTENDVFLFTLEKTTNDEYLVHSAKYLSSFNPGGYSNQPSFTHSGDLLLSVRKPGETQNDIWQFSLTSRKYKRLTETSAMEYSPQIHPGEEHLTVLQKINGDPLHQQVCKIDLRSGVLEVITADMKDIGYYTWLSPTEIGLFRIENGSNRLTYFNLNENKSRRITTSVGRTLAVDKSGALIYVHKFTDEYWYIKKYNPSTSAIEIVARTTGKSEDFAIAPDGTYFMGQNHLLFALNPEKEKNWKQIADLSIYGIKFITRMAISPDGKKIILIATRENV